MIEVLPESVITSLFSLNVKLERPAALPEITPLVNETVLEGGKRLRPALCFLMGELFGYSGAVMAPFARAAELTHAASLAHDDVIDEAKTRRDQPTLNARTSNAHAVLAGDLLLARVLVEMTEQGNLEIIRRLASVVEDLSTGEWLQLKLRGRVDVTREELDQVARLKTASLMGWCCSVPALLESQKSDLAEDCQSFGVSVGMAFQWIDDVLDFSEGTGKPFAQDLHEGLMNQVAVTLREKEPTLSAGLAQALTDPRQIRVGAWAPALLEGAKSVVRKRALDEIGRARASLDVLVSQVDANRRAPEVVGALHGILGLLAERAT